MDENFKCEKCEASFASQDALNSHFNAKHYVPPVEPFYNKLKKPLKYLIVVLILVAIGWGVFQWIANGTRIGPVGSTHIHQDVKVYLDGTQLSLSQQKYQVRAPQVHVESGDGDVIHVHATGVPIGMFFDSLGMKLSSTCFKTDNGTNYCNNGNRTLKFYVNGQLNSEFDKYLLRDLDKILISYGSEGEAAIQRQLETITDKAKTAGNEKVLDPLARHAAST